MLKSEPPSSGARGLTDSPNALVLDFEGVVNTKLVGSFYDGVGGPNYGVVFGPAATAVVDLDLGLDLATVPSGATAALLSAAASAHVTVASGFTGCLSLQVASLVDGAPPELPLVAQGLIVAAGAHRLAGRIEPALDALWSAWPMLQADTCDQGMAERELARCQRAGGRPTEAASSYAQAAATFAAAGERFLAADTEREGGVQPGT